MSRVVIEFGYPVNLEEGLITGPGASRSPADLTKEYGAGCLSSLLLNSGSAVPVTFKAATNDANGVVSGGFKMPFSKVACALGPTSTSNESCFTLAANSTVMPAEQTNIFNPAEQEKLGASPVNDTDTSDATAALDAMGLKCPFDEDAESLLALVNGEAKATTGKSDLSTTVKSCFYRNTNTDGGDDVTPDADDVDVAAAVQRNQVNDFTL